MTFRRLCCCKPRCAGLPSHDGNAGWLMAIVLRRWADVAFSRGTVSPLHAAVNLLGSFNTIFGPNDVCSTKTQASDLLHVRIRNHEMCNSLRQGCGSIGGKASLSQLAWHLASVDVVATCCLAAFDVPSCSECVDTVLLS